MVLCLGRGTFFLGVAPFCDDVIPQDRRTEIQNGRQRWRKFEMSDEIQNGCQR